jgi:hypothetical protein
MCSFEGHSDDYRTHYVLLAREGDNGVFYREGIMDLQKREWEAANPVMEEVRLG